MAYAPYAVAKGGFTTETPARERPGFFRRFLTAMMAARQRQADVDAVGHAVGADGLGRLMGGHRRFPFLLIECCIARFPRAKKPCRQQRRLAG